MTLVVEVYGDDVEEQSEDEFDYGYFSEVRCVWSAYNFFCSVRLTDFGFVENMCFCHCLH